MTWAEFKALLLDANLQQREFAKLNGWDETTINKWKRTKVPRYAQNIAILLANDPKRIKELRETDG